MTEASSASCGASSSNLASSKISTKIGPICLLVLGMAGSGKTSLVRALTTHLIASSKPPYVINLDPACFEVPYPCHIDIRDTVKYKQVMKEFGLGPNGGIITSLNLFSTRFDQVMQLLAKRESQHEYVILDTPGQIEVFTWSASGTIVTDTLASMYPTIVIYVMDLPRCSSPVTFMSNMLYACSVLYKTKLPFLIALNKCDQQNANLAKAWMSDFEQFDFALDKDTSYVGNLTRSMSLVLDAFYKDLQTVAVSAATGDGFEQMIDKFDILRKEYLDVYRPEYERIRHLADQKKEKQNAGQHSDDDYADAGQSSQQKHASKKEELIQFASLSHDYDLMMARDDADDDEEFEEEEDNEKQEVVSEDEEEKREYKEFADTFVSKLKCDQQEQKKKE